MNLLLRSVGKRLSMVAVMFVVLLGHAGSVWAQAYCFPANWWGFDLVNSANGQATINDQTCGCGSSARYVDSGGGCNAAVTTRTTSAAHNGDSWAVYVRSDYFTSCSNNSDISVSGSCRLTGKSQWYSVVATCSDHNTTATVTMDSTILPLTPCTIEYKADSANFNDVHVRDVIKFKNAITVTTPAPAYAAIGTSFNVAATALVGTVTISTSGNCTASSTGSGTASITMTGASSADCVVNYSSASDATYGADSVTNNTNNNYYEGAYGGIRLNFKAFSLFDLLMTCGPTCAVTSANSTSWLQAGAGVVAGNSTNPGDTWFIRVATGTGADTTYTIASQINNMCLAKSGSNQVFAACNSADTAQQWTIAPFNGTNPANAPAGVEFALPAAPGVWANANIGWGNNYMPIGVSSDHDWTSAFFLGGAVARADHIRFEFNGNTAYTCQPKSITIKACANAACSSLYTSNMTLTPATSSGTGSWAGLSAAPSTTFIGSTTATLADTTDGANPTLSYSMSGSSYLSLPPTNSALECYNTATSSIVSCAGVLNYSKTECGFDAVEHNAAVGTHLYTKLANVAFPNSGIDVVATLTVAGVTSVNTSYTSAPTVELVDDTTNTQCSDRAVVGSVTFSPAVPSAFTSGKLVVIPTVPNPVARAKVRIRDTVRGVTMCSSDGFTIRPTEFSVTLGYAGDPLIAGQSTDGVATAFTLTAAARTGWSGAPLASTGYATAGYTGTATVEWTTAALKDWTNTALPYSSGFTPATLITGGFAAGNGTTGVGSFYYDDFGTLTLANASNIVVDKTFASVSSDIANNDCDSTTSPYSNSVSGGKYGCYVPSTAPSALTTKRFRPQHYEAVSSATASPACAAGKFTYFGQPFLGGAITLTAKSASGTTMSRLNGSPSNAASYYVSAMNDTTWLTTLGFSTSSAALPTYSLQASAWNSGVYSVAGTSVFAIRPTTPVGPYDDFKAALTVNDVDSVRITSCSDGAGNGGTIIDGKDLAGVIAGNTKLSNCVPANASASPRPTRLRYGTLKLDNAYGSELLALHVPMKAMYWGGSSNGWTVNTDDTACTTVAVTRVASGNYKGVLTAGTVGTISTTAFTGGVGSIKIDKPTGAVTGSVDVGVNLGTAAPVADCLTAHLSTAAPGTSLSWLRGNWCGGSYGADPTARATFGAAKSPFLYRREKF